MNRLSVRLASAIVLTTLVAVGLVAFVVNRAASTEFRRYLSGNETAAGAALAPRLTAYYEHTGSWAGIETVLAEEDLAPGLGRGGRGRNAALGQGRGPALLLADATGHIVYDSQGQLQGEALSQAEQDLALPLTSGGSTIGYLLLLHGAGSQLAAPEQAFLDRVNQALMLAAGLAALLGVALGGLLARTLSAPLQRVSAGAQAIAAGDLSQRVPEQGTLETKALAYSFNHMAADLQRAEQQRRNLMADVAHELRTPLTVIQGNLQALLDGVYPLERAEIATIYDETRLLSRLVADLRELALAEAGQLRLDLRPVDVTAALQQVGATFAPLAEAQQITLAVLPAAAAASPGEPLWVLADPDRLAQVLRNLLSNALRQLPAGGRIAVSAELTSATTPPDGKDLQYDRSQPLTGTHCLISVSDDGPGIPADELPHVFDRFWSRSRDADSPGSGLGLAIVRSLVEAQGGRIGVTSSPGRGACFWFTLPVAPPTMSNQL